jgi:transposase
MASLFTQAPPDHSEEKSRGLPPDMRQLIVDLKAEHPGFRPNEIATICFLRFGRRPSPHTVQRVLADGPLPCIPARRFPPYTQIAEPFERRKVVIPLHAEGWSVSTIAAYMQTTRDTIYDIRHRFATEGYAGLDDKSRAPHNPARKVTMRDMNEVKKLASNPDLGAYRVMAALEQLGIQLSQRTCGRLLALNRSHDAHRGAKRCTSSEEGDAGHSLPFATSTGLWMSVISKSIAFQKSKGRSI